MSDIIFDIFHDLWCSFWQILKTLNNNVEFRILSICLTFTEENTHHIICNETRLFSTWSLKNVFMDIRKYHTDFTETLLKNCVFYDKDLQKAEITLKNNTIWIQKQTHNFSRLGCWSSFSTVDLSFGASAPLIMSVLSFPR